MNRHSKAIGGMKFHSVTTVGMKRHLIAIVGVRRHSEAIARVNITYNGLAKKVRFFKQVTGVSTIIQKYKN